MGAAAFWIAVGAVLVAGGWWKSRSEAMKHETIRRIIEKTGQVDEAKLKELFEPPVPGWVRERIELIKTITANTGPLDDARIRELIQPPVSAWGNGSTTGDSYRFLRGFGTVVMFVSLGIVIAVSILYRGGIAQQPELMFGLALASVVALFGAGMFYASRFCESPLPPKGDRA